MHRIFVYGTLKRGQPNHYLIDDADNGIARYIGEAQTVEKWPLVVTTPYNIPFLLDTKGTGNRVTGEVFDVDDAMLHVLDTLEEHPHLYERALLDLEINSSDGKHVTGETENDKCFVQCYTYLMKNFKAEISELPSITCYESDGTKGYVLPRDRKSNTPTRVYVKKPEFM